MSDPRIPSQYQELIQEAYKNGDIDDSKSRPLKRRRKDEHQSEESSSEKSEEKPLKEWRFADALGVKVYGKHSIAKKDETPLTGVQTIPDDVDEADFGDSDEDYEEDEDISSDEFEDVDLNHVSSSDNDKDKQVNISIKLHDHKRKKRKTVVSREERSFRKEIHMLYLFTMIAHGVCRNAWCSDRKLLKILRQHIPTRIANHLQKYIKHRKEPNSSVQSKTRMLLDILKEMMIYWNHNWTVDLSAPALYKRGWNELDNPVTYRNYTKRKFDRAIRHRTGSRDIAAQGFICLLRSVGIKARLIFSLQPPDFTNLSPIQSIMKEYQYSEEKRLKTISPKKKKSNSLTQHEKLLNDLRGRSKPYTNARKDDIEDSSEKYGNYPVFWCEVWDEDAKRFITVDPMVKKTIEIVRKKSQLEPAMSDKLNNAFYVIGFDNRGGVRDITRRYAQFYNAKVRKKRITRDEDGSHWYNSMIRGANPSWRTKENRIDKFEQLEFEDLGLREGMPNSIQDFKNHPVYVIESQLKSNEILKPKISCGTIRKKSRKTKQGILIPVYKRSNVQVVRSAKAWYLRGRVLKIGSRPLKTKKANNAFKRGSNSEEEEDDVVRLYAEYQTNLYEPPPIKNGEIPRNAFGNIDVYQPWMVPDGCVHIKDDEAEKAAKLMDIEYAPAATGFDFDGDHRSVNGGASVHIQGIVTFSEYKDAVELVCQGLREFYAQQEHEKAELVALHAWKILLTKLEISDRLNREHGKTTNMKERGKTTLMEKSSDEESNEEQYEGGGFMLDDAKNVDEEMYFGKEGEGLDSDPVGEVDASDFDEAVAEEPEGKVHESAKEKANDKEAKNESEDTKAKTSEDQPDEFDDFMKEIGLDENRKNDIEEKGSEDEKSFGNGTDVVEDSSKNKHHQEIIISSDSDSDNLMTVPKVETISIDDEPMHEPKVDSSAKQVTPISLDSESSLDTKENDDNDSVVALSSGSEIVDVESDSEGYDFEYSDSM